MKPRTVRWRFALLVPITVAIVAGSTLLGDTPISLHDIFAAPSGASAAAHGPGYVFWELRVPRAALAACVGAGLAVGGVVFQALFRNPLAEPYTLGVASGASLAAAAGFLWHVAEYGPWLGIPLLSVCAFGGALSAMALVYLISRTRGGRDMGRLLLAGVCIAYLCAAGILVVFYFSDRAITNEVVHWTIGSLGRHRGLRSAAEVLIVLVPVVAYVLYSHRSLDLLSFGEHLAASRGVDVERTIWTSYTLVGVLVAVIVANCGPIGFVGLMVPHIARALFGVRTVVLVSGAALVGAAFLALCDGLARSLPVTELPVGVVTNILGAVFFFYLLATRDIGSRPIG